jgi:hypothetical protein
MSGPIVVDSESGGAYSHYPKFKTSTDNGGSGRFKKNVLPVIGPLHTRSTARISRGR